MDCTHGFIGAGKCPICHRNIPDTMQKLQVDNLQQAARIKELENRLEIDPRHSIDGIEARDETIRLQDLKLAELEAIIRNNDILSKLAIDEKKAVLATADYRILVLEASLNEMVGYAKELRSALNNTAGILDRMETNTPSHLINALALPLPKAMQA